MPAVRVDVNGLKEAETRMQRAATALTGDMAPVYERGTKAVARDASRRAPRRTGHLASAGISTTVTKDEGTVAVRSRDVVYGPVIHNGWPTRGAGKGLTSKQARQRYSGVLSARTAGRTARLSSDRTIRRKGQVTQKGAVRGGPIKPNPFLFDAAGAETAKIYHDFDRTVDRIAKAADG